MRSTFKVLFYLKRNAPKKNGLVPVMCRVTVNGKVSQFSCKLDVEEKSWNVELGRLSGRSLIAQEGNRMLDKIRVGINKAYQEICDRDNYVTAEKVRNAFLGLGMKHETLLAVFTQHNEDYAKQVGKIKSERSYWKYCTVYNHLSEFIKQRYKVNDIALEELFRPQYIQVGNIDGIVHPEVILLGKSVIEIIHRTVPSIEYVGFHSCGLCQSA